MYLFGTCRSWCNRTRWSSGARSSRKTEVQRYERQLTTQQKDERRQDNGDRRWPTSQHPSDLLRSLTREQDRWTARHHLNHTLCFAIFELCTCPAWGTWCACIYLVYSMSLSDVCSGQAPSCQLLQYSSSKVSYLYIHNRYVPLNMLVHVCTTHFPSLINSQRSPKHCTPKRTYRSSLHVYMYTIDREIFTIKIICILNVHVKDRISAGVNVVRMYMYMLRTDHKLD